MKTNECKKMPGLAQKNEHYSSGFWSKNIDGVSYNQLQKFWCELSPKSRQELLKIDKQTLFEQARKNMCCSKCNDLLLEDFLKITSYGRSLQQKDLAGNLPCNRSGGSDDQTDCNSVVEYTGELQDPFVHPWGGLTTTRNGSLTLLDCYLYAKSYKGLQIVFESARARERERELLYPDACGSVGRVSGYRKVHGTRETCALHTTCLSSDTLVDFWFALGVESQRSLFRMKEEDFIEKLTYRFERRKFCRNCRKNVIREFKQLKELERMQRKPQCTDWFCVADTVFPYKVDVDSVRADWSQYFTENDGYHQFEWAIGTREGKSDILEFKCVGNDRNAQVNDLDLCGFNVCYITLRAFNKNGRFSEISVKAYALESQQCVHTRLVVGDGFVSINPGSCIQMFFEHAEIAEAQEEEDEEEEDEDMLDRDENELDDECLRPRKHAKSPELAREYLLDAATVIFKEQVEKAFREGTCRQNAHNIFVCLSSKLLEQRVHISCQEIVTLEKQKKLLEEEETERREEAERKERKRTKEREKKLRRKERLKVKEQEKEKQNPKFDDKAILSRKVESSQTNNTISCEESGIETGDVDLSPPGFHDDQNVECLDDEDENECFTNNSPKPVNQTTKVLQPDHNRSHEDFHCSDNMNGKRYDYHSCKCKPIYGYREKVQSNISATKSMPESNKMFKSDFDLDVSKLANRANRCTLSDCREELRPRSKVIISQNPSTMDPLNARKDLESMELNSSNSEVSSVTYSTFKREENGNVCYVVKSADTSRDKKMEVHIKPKKDSMMSKTSSSDNCSSCLNKEDKNTTSSDNGNTESFSDSKDASQQENLVHTQNNMPACREKMTEKGTDEIDVSVVKNLFTLPADNQESKLSGVLSQNMGNMAASVDTGSYLSQPQSMMFPQMLNQSIPLSIFQAPEMGYYYQAPASWSAAQANVLIPLPNPNHYVYSGPPLGYSLNGQYETPLNYSATPFFSSGLVPGFHNTMNTMDKAQTLAPLEHSCLKEADEKKLNIRETPSSGDPQTDSNENFSLFHFGGPVALSTAGKSDLDHSKDEISKDLSLQFSGDHVFSDPTSNTKEKESPVGEEYNLFATSKGLRFSIF